MRHFLLARPAEVTPIRELDGRVIGNGGRGAVTEQLQSMYFDQVYGRSHLHKNWNAYI